MDQLVLNVLKFTATKDAVCLGLEQMSAEERYKVIRKSLKQMSEQERGKIVRRTFRCMSKEEKMKLAALVLKQLSEQERCTTIKPYVDRFQELVEKEKSEWNRYVIRLRAWNKNPGWFGIPTEPEIKFWNRPSHFFSLNL